MTNPGGVEFTERSEADSDVALGDVLQPPSVPARAHVTQLADVTVRDGMQSLLAGRVQQHHLLETVRHLAKAGFARLEVWGGTTFQIPVLFKNENPFTNLEQMRDVIHQSAAEAGVAPPKLSMLLRGRNLVGVRAYPDEIIREFVKQSAASGVEVFRIFDALNDIDSVKAAMDAAAELRKTNPNIEVEGTLSFTKIDKEEIAAHPELAVLHSVAAYIAYAKQLKAHGATSICIKDMAGMMEPEDVAPLVQALKNEVGLPIVLHAHSAMGYSNATIQEAIRCGVDMVDTAAEALSGGSGHSASSDIANAAAAAGLTDKLAPIDAACVEKANDSIHTWRGLYSQFELPYIPGLEERLRKSHVPGGMATTFWENIDKQFARHYTARGLPFGVEEKTQILFAILEEVPLVRARAGYISLVTPSSQVVGAQAAAHVEEFIKATLAGNVPDDVQKEALRFGKLNDDFAKMIRETAARVTARPEEHLCTMPDAKVLTKAQSQTMLDVVDKRSFDEFVQAAQAYTPAYEEGSALYKDAEDRDKILHKNALILAIMGAPGEQFLKVASSPKTTEIPAGFTDYQAKLNKGLSFTQTRLESPHFADQATRVLETYAQAKLRAVRFHDETVLGTPGNAGEAPLMEAAAAVKQLLKDCSMPMNGQVQPRSVNDSRNFIREAKAYLTMRSAALGIATPEITFSPYALNRPGNNWLERAEAANAQVAAR